MNPQQIQIWIDKTMTAVSGAAVLSQSSGREVARHALKNLFELTNGDASASLQVVRQISDFAVRRRLLEVFRQSFVETSSVFTSQIFFEPGDFSDNRFSEAFDQDLLILWRETGRDAKLLNEAIKNYPNAARIRIKNRLKSKEFNEKRRIRHAVKTAFSHANSQSNGLVTLMALAIFLALLIIMFD